MCVYDATRLIVYADNFIHFDGEAQKTSRIHHFSLSENIISFSWQPIEETDWETETDSNLEHQIS